MPKKATLLLVEDERDLATIVRDTLTMLDYRVLLAADGQEGLALYREQQPDLIVADVMMPRMDGFELVRRVRSRDKHTPIIFLTARTDTDDVVSGLRMGANDYLRKPFAMRELLVRIEILLNRHTPLAATSSPPPNAPQEMAGGALSEDSVQPLEVLVEEADPLAHDFAPLALGRFVLHRAAQRLVLDDGSATSLTHREAEILYRLFAQPNAVVATRPLLLALWGQDTVCNARSLHVFVSKLRAKLALDPTLRLLNVHGLGYRLVVEPPL